MESKLEEKEKNISRKTHGNKLNSVGRLLGMNTEEGKDQFS